MNRTRTKRPSKTANTDALGYVNLGAAGPVTVSDGITWKRIPTSFLRDCLRHTLAENGGKVLRKNVDRGATCTHVAVWLHAPDGTEWVVTSVSDLPRHFQMMREADRAAVEAEGGFGRMGAA